EFVQFMFDRSQPHTDTLGLVAELSRSNRYLLATLNNESLELNIHRIEKFHLADYFTAFFSSCLLGTMKPDSEIYRKALQITQRCPDECILIDDRQANLEPAQHLGMNTIHYQDAHQLRQSTSAYAEKSCVSRKSVRSGPY